MSSPPPHSAQGGPARTLTAYLNALGFSFVEIGLIATAALFGSALVTLVFGLIGVRYDLRWLLIIASAAMISTGVSLSLAQSFAIIVLIAFVGTANPSAGSVSYFVPLEHTVLAGAADHAQRTRIFSRYSLVGALAGAIGSLAAAIPDLASNYGFA